MASGKVFEVLDELQGLHDGAHGGPRLGVAVQAGLRQDRGLPGTLDGVLALQAGVQQAEEAAPVAEELA